MALGKLFHYSVDALLVSMLLAAVHRNTGLVFNTYEFSSTDVRSLFTKYLAVGELSYDYFVSSLKGSGYFTLKRITNVDDLKNKVKQSVNEFIDETGKK